MLLQAIMKDRTVAPPKYLPESHSPAQFCPTLPSCSLAQSIGRKSSSRIPWPCWGPADLVFEQWYILLGSLLTVWIRHQTVVPQTRYPLGWCVHWVLLTNTDAQKSCVVILKRDLLQLEHTRPTVRNEAQWYHLLFLECTLLLNNSTNTGAPRHNFAFLKVLTDL